MLTYLFFGSFNPIHNGHLALIEYVLRIRQNELWIIVSPQNPQKDPNGLLPFEDRLNMVRLSTQRFADRIKVLDIESRLPKPSYTINTISELKKEYPKRNFCILAGSDIADTIRTWYKYEELMKLTQVEIYPRKETDRWKCSDNLKEAPVLEYSSTLFRKTKDYSFIPKEAADYIKSNRLY